MGAICHHAGLFYSCKLTYAQAVHNFTIGGIECVKQYGAHACDRAMHLAQLQLSKLSKG